jgi:hypothetical protein
MTQSLTFTAPDDWHIHLTSTCATGICSVKLSQTQRANSAAS